MDPLGPSRRAAVDGEQGQQHQQGGGPNRRAAAAGLLPRRARRARRGRARGAVRARGAPVVGAARRALGGGALVGAGRRALGGAALVRAARRALGRAACVLLRCRALARPLPLGGGVLVAVHAGRLLVAQGAKALGGLGDLALLLLRLGLLLLVVLVRLLVFGLLLLHQGLLLLLLRGLLLGHLQRVHCALLRHGGLRVRGAGAICLVLGRLRLLELLAAPLEILHLLLDLGLGLLGLRGAIGLAVGRGRGAGGVVCGGLVGALLGVLRVHLGLFKLPVGLVQILLRPLHCLALLLRGSLGLLHLGPQVVVLHLCLPLAAVGILVLHIVVVELAGVLHQRVRVIEVEVRTHLGLHVVRVVLAPERLVRLRVQRRRHR